MNGLTLIVIIIGIIGAAVQAWDRYFADPPTVDGKQCLACRSTNIETIAPQVYSCHACDYVGGPGYKQYAEEKQLAQMNNLSEAERNKRAIEQLDDARLLLRALEGNIDAAIQLAHTPGTVKRRNHQNNMSQYDVKANELHKINSELIRYNNLIDRAEKLSERELAHLHIHADTKAMLFEQFSRDEARNAHHTGHMKQTHTSLLPLRSDMTGTLDELTRELSSLRTAPSNLQF